MTTQITRRQALLTLSATGAGLACPWRVQAQTKGPLHHILCGYPAGGTIDVVSRKLAERLSGVAAHVVVDNKPGAAGRLAVEALKSAPPDGTTMLVTPGSVMVMYPHIYKNLSYDVFADLAPVSTVGVAAFALAVGPAVPASIATLDQFLVWCRANRTQAQCGNPGAGSFPHFMAMLLARDAKVEFTHVPYRGGLVAMQEVAAGQVSAAFSTESSAVALEKAGKLRVLATTGYERSPFLPQVPTFREAGYPNLAQTEWFAAFMPARTPAAVVASASTRIRTALEDPDLREVWRNIALSPASSTPAELQTALRKDHDFWGPLIKASGFTPEA